MELWHAWTCPYCMRVRIALTEKGLSFTEHEVELANKPPELVALNPPRGGVPVLVEDGAVIPESLVILEYLEDRYPEPRLLPADPLGRARARLLYEQVGALLAPHLPKVLRGSPAEKADAEAAVRAGLTALEEQCPPEGHLLGGFTIADIALACLVAKLPAPLHPEALGLPKLGRWEALVRARPSVATHTATSRPASA